MPQVEGGRLKGTGLPRALAAQNIGSSRQLIHAEGHRLHLCWAGAEHVLFQCPLLDTPGFGHHGQDAVFLQLPECIMFMAQHLAVRCFFGHVVTGFNKCRHNDFARGIQDPGGVICEVPETPCSHRDDPFMVNGDISMVKHGVMLIAGIQMIDVLDDQRRFHRALLTI